MAFEVAVKADYKYEDSIFANSPCNAHLVVVDVDEDGLRIGGKGNNGNMVIEFEIVAASDPTQGGLHYRSYFTKSVDAAWAILNFCIASGIKATDGTVITSEYIKKLQDAGRGPEIDFEQAALGLQLFGKIEWNEYDGKKNLKIQGRGFYHLTSKQCLNEKNWPRNPDFIAAFVKKTGIVMPKPGTNDAASSPAASKPQGQPATKTAAAALSGLTL